MPMGPIDIVLAQTIRQLLNNVVEPFDQSDKLVKDIAVEAANSLREYGTVDLEMFTESSCLANNNANDSVYSHLLSLRLMLT